MDENSNSPGLDRRTILKAGVWAAPAIVLATATPAAAASIDTGSVPVSRLEAQAHAFSAEGQLGPLHWAGGQVNYTPQAGDPPSAIVPWVATITLPDGTTETLGSGSLVVMQFDIAQTQEFDYGTAPMETGTYTVTFTISGSDTFKTATESLTLPAA